MTGRGPPTATVPDPGPEPPRSAAVHPQAVTR